MEYLIQFRVNAPEVYYEQPVNFDLKGIFLTLFLYDLDKISNGKKLHVIVSAKSKEEAYGKAWKELGDFNNRLIFFFGKPIIISHWEFIIESQAGFEQRSIVFRDIELPGKEELFIDRLLSHRDFFSTNIADCDKAAIGYYNEALRSESPTEQFRCLYLSLEALVGHENAEVACDGCGEKLKCPKCKNTKKYPRVTKKRIDDYLIKTNEDDIMIGRKLAGSELVKLRAFLSHAQNKKLPISLSDLNDNIDSLSFIITKQIENKYNIPSYGRSMIKYGSVAIVDYYKYHTLQIQNKFALDIPPLDELKNHKKGTRWVKN